MSKKDAKNALLFGSYIAKTSLNVFPEVSVPSFPDDDLNKAAEELIAEHLITPLPIGSVSDIVHCPYEITPKGQDVLEGLGKADLSLFKIIIATGGSTVHYHEEKHQLTNTTTFEQNMVKRIETSAATDKEKHEAKSKLKEFLSHPLLATALEALLKATLKA
jgi:hypothetical protein